MVMSAMALVMIYFVPKLLGSSVEANQENEMAIERTLTLFDYDKVKDARRGVWRRFVVYGSTVPFGAGFSRVGAAAGAFSKANAADPYFGPNVFFADNLWLAALIEIGIPGMLLLMLLIGGLLYRGVSEQKKIRDTDMRLCHLAILSALIAMGVGFFGAEGAIYNPEASFFWFFAGVMMKIPYLDREKLKQKQASAEA